MGVIDRHLQARNDEAKEQEELERELELADYNDGPTVRKRHPNSLHTLREKKEFTVLWLYI